MEGVALQGKIQRILAMLSPEYFNYKDNVLLEYEQQGRKQSLLSKNMKIDYLQTFSFPGGKEYACQCRRCGFHPWVGKKPWRRKWQPTPVFLPGKSHGQSSLAGYSLWGHKESNMTQD